MGSAAPLAEFDEALAVQGFYTQVQKERSDKALDAFDLEQREAPGQSELDAFRMLEAQGVLSQADFYSPTKAADGFYSKRLKEHAQQKSANELIDDDVHGLLEPAKVLDDRRYKILGFSELPQMWARGYELSRGERRTYRGVSRRSFRCPADTHGQTG